jgi:D-alanine-D-alanine ligase
MEIGVLMGGISNEREISILSGRSIAQGLCAAGFKADEIIVREDFAARIKEYRHYDVLFNALHGFFGEDGQVQALLEAESVAYTGCGVESSRLLMDKVATKRLCDAQGLLNAPWYTLTEPTAAIPKGFKLPLVVKPTDAGSSVNVFIVHEKSAYVEAVEAVLADSETVLVEAYIPGRELTVGIVGEIVLPVIELRTQHEFFDYEAKYTDEDTQYLCPAPLSVGSRRAAMDLATQAFEVFDCRDLVRFDMILSDDNRMYLLEGNTIPGFTDHSLVPKAAGVAGIPFDQLCASIVEMAVKRARKKVTAGSR